MRYISFARLRRLAAQARHNLQYTRNDGFYWDQYAREQIALHPNQVVGAEWKNEERFVALLEKYATPGTDSLEIGCGGGRITKIASRLVGRLQATDVSTEMLRNCALTVQCPNVSFHKTDGFTLSAFAEESVDLVFSHDVFVHFSSHEVYAYLREIKRLLRPKGVALISFYSFVTHFDLFKEMSFRLLKRHATAPPMRVHFVTEEIISVMLRDLDLELLEVDRGDFLIVAFGHAP